MSLFGGFQLLHKAFPYIESGADLVAKLKHRLASNGRFFRKSERLKIMAFGHSKTLAGFVPSLFDSQLSAAGFSGVESWNFGLPGDARFVDDLERMIDRGTAPDVVLLIIPWPDNFETRPGIFHFLEHDQEIMDRLFPFRKLPRDFLIMGMDSYFKPGLSRHAYQQNERTVKQVEADRGYYFIARQSHFKNNELPPGLRLPTDTPDKPAPRHVQLGPVFSHLSRLFQAHNIECIFIPSYFREGQFAPAASPNSVSINILANESRFRVAGPDYLLYPNQLFSDFTHLNPAGAKTYTRDVAALVLSSLRSYRGSK